MSLLAIDSFRRGNIVRFKKAICRINAISAEKNVLTLQEITGKWLAPDTELNEIRAIGISKKKLPDIGFAFLQENKRNEAFYLNMQGYHPFLITIENDGRCYYDNNVLLNYVHDLQNLFYCLRGMELMGDFAKLAKGR